MLVSRCSRPAKPISCMLYMDTGLQSIPCAPRTPQVMGCEFFGVFSSTQALQLPTGLCHAPSGIPHPQTSQAQAGGGCRSPGGC